MYVVSLVQEVKCGSVMDAAVQGGKDGIGEIKTATL